MGGGRAGQRLRSVTVGPQRSRLSGLGCAAARGAGVSPPGGLGCHRPGLWGVTDRGSELSRAGGLGSPARVSELSRSGPHRSPGTPDRVP